jgi:hypothetical protein
MKTSEIVHKMDKCFTKLRMPMWVNYNNKVFLPCKYFKYFAPSQVHKFSL